MRYTSAIWQQAARITYHLLAAQHEPYKISLTLNRKRSRGFWKKV